MLNTPDILSSLWLTIVTALKGLIMQIYTFFKEISKWFSNRLIECIGKEREGK